MPARRLAARWLVPIEGPPVEHGALLIGSDGRIAAVGPDSSVPKPPDVEAESFDDAILLPGLINTHTHLELTGLAQAAPGADFPAWIRRLRQRKAERSAEEFLAAAHQGIEDCWAAGVTTVGDTGDSGSVIQALAERGGSGLAYQEVFGPHPAQCEESLAGLQQRVEALAAYAVGRVRIGVSPHAPYTVSGRLFGATARWAGHETLPMAVHLAESPAEVELLASGTGGFADAWHARGIPLPSPLGRTPVEWLECHDALSDRTLCIHLVQVTSSDISLLARAAASVAHCPLSNSAHKHGIAPLRSLLNAGLRVGVGTDSVISVESLDLLAEARAAALLADLDSSGALALCTISAARALGMDAAIGSLRVGKWGDCTVVRPHPASAGLEPAARVLRSRRRDVMATFVGGKDVHRVERMV